MQEKYGTATVGEKFSKSAATIHPALVNYSTEDFVSGGFAYTMLSLT